MKEFYNHEIVTLAVYLLSGDTSPAETEDSAAKTNEIAEGDTPRIEGGTAGYRLLHRRVLLLVDERIILCRSG